jgi:predicted methyltransferase
MENSCVSEPAIFKGEADLLLEQTGLRRPMTSLTRCVHGLAVRRAGFWIRTIAVAASLALIGSAPELRAEPRASADSIQHVEAIPPQNIPSAIEKGVNAPDRAGGDKLLDAGRRPSQVMTFFGIAPGMKVADLYAGGGYTTELLARIVGPEGKVYSQNAPFPPKFKKIEKAWNQRLKEPALANVIIVRKPFDAEDLIPAKPGSLDAVLIHLNYHDLVRHGVNRNKVNTSVLRALKPDGVYGIVDHSAQPGSGFRDVKTLHRIDEKAVIKEVERAGFRLVATSSALRHREDDRTTSAFAHRGTTDRFMLKFVKVPESGKARQPQ